MGYLQASAVAASTGLHIGKGTLPIQICSKTCKNCKNYWSKHDKPSQFLRYICETANSAPILRRLDIMQKQANIILSLTLLLLIAACTAAGNHQLRQSQKYDCESEIGDNAKLKCYSNALRISVHREITSALKDWAAFEPNFTQGDPRSGLRIDIELNDNGEIKNIKLDQPSENLSFDNAIIQAIHNAAPFSLPKDKALRKRLLKFSYNIVF